MPGSRVGIVFHIDAFLDFNFIYSASPPTPPTFIVYLPVIYLLLAFNDSGTQSLI